MSELVSLASISILTLVCAICINVVDSIVLSITSHFKRNTSIVVNFKLVLVAISYVIVISYILYNSILNF